VLPIPGRSSWRSGEANTDKKTDSEPPAPGFLRELLESGVRKRILPVALFALGFLALAVAADEATLVQTLARQLNVTDEQAAARAGAALSVEKGEP
jgi:hypothetical protein